MNKGSHLQISFGEGVCKCIFYILGDGFALRNTQLYDEFWKEKREKSFNAGSQSFSIHACIQQAIMCGDTWDGDEMEMKREENGIKKLLSNKMCLYGNL